MEPNTDNFYQINYNKDDLFGGYMRNECVQEAENQVQQYLPPFPVISNMSQPLMYNMESQPMYDLMYGPQSLYQNTYANGNAYTQPVDTAWLPDTCITSPQREKFKDDISECCRLDNINCTPLSEVYKSVNKDLYYEYLYENQRYELPSCSQILESIECKNNNNETNVPLVNSKLYVYPNVDQTKELPSCSQFTQDFYSGSADYEMDNKLLMEPCEEIDLLSTDPSPNFLQPANVEEILQSPKNDENDEESDIIVEDTEEDVTESEEDKEELKPCLLCNAVIENQYYDILSKGSTYTSFSHTRITDKLQELLGNVPVHSSNMCSVCMTLINTLDNLEMQLETIRQDVMSKFSKTAKNLSLACTQNETLQSKVIKKSTKSMKYKYKNVCGLHTFKCRVCEKIFSLKKFYKHHMSKHKTPQTYLCERCGVCFNNRSVFITHLKEYYKKKCLICNEEIYPDIKHICDKNNKCCICHMCGKKFKTRMSLKQHEYMCSGNLPYKCDTCNKCFTSSTRLKNHIKLQHIKDFIETCTICNKGFVKLSDYKNHMLKHSEEKRFKCKICGNCYKRKSNLNQHSKKHDKNMPFICDICQKGFSRKEALISHLNFHNGLKPYPCNICDKKFGSQKNLDQHLRVHRKRAEMKTCTVCSKQITNQNFVEHMRTHSGEKYLGCPECTLKFSTKNSLNKHIKRIHTKNDI